MNHEEIYNFDTNQKLRRLKVQMKAIRLGMRYLQDQGASGNSTWQQLANELISLKADYRYLTYEKNHGSLAAEMVVGSYPGF
jgi:hypothetical protein